ncbi:hypothetical protein ABB37_00084 [Leptomonas pyrrhocoris]|uniref:Uncharacterized protein n=1 Tax=Leptomonas pyrrhocoris TaxID=157538 RepID=A0A0N0DZU8_LEPPY|nr:hypothetical protein ABB37_00084 [Leptomonas pyrrhocoris]XP_015664151.1 hypothetical protein ABB37_00084 [Leptomonas pyrrhocoris]KPA85711.1 hypothetical protein ABB37_00084 [Leptomonas pyrrhocoris]KPA85712.1 hypothetical protein ABB37_00084 [Leptomonas pyrrhocoris]|eukprot:XP_015664150.1 hypothetical protein ABB37_00084 [Leptomonas pyrrhocoris]
MSSGKTGNKWVSTRVLQQKQQQTPAAAPTSGNAVAGSKIMEDKAIAAARIKDSQSSPSPETEVPESKFFEVQEATDALSNLAHNADPKVYELCGEPVVQPHQTAEEYHALIMEQVQQQTR